VSVSKKETKTNSAMDSVSHYLGIRVISNNYYRRD